MAVTAVVDEGETSTPPPPPPPPPRTSRAWFCTTGLPADIVVDVHPITFHLHKFPLMSKSRKIQRLISDQDWLQQQQTEIREDGGGELYRIALPEFPGGPGAFEAAAKFCYGVKVDLNAWNAAPLRCAAEHLEMTDDYAVDNLVSRTEMHLNTVVLRHLVDAAKALKSCEELMPLAHNIGIVGRCVEAIAQRVPALDAGTLLGWPVNSGRGGRVDAAGSWFEELAMLSWPMYKRVMAAMAAKDVNASVIDGCLIAYARRSVPGLSRPAWRHASAPVKSEVEQRELLEAVVAGLSPKSSHDDGDGGVVTVRFLFSMLRTAHILCASEECRAALERKIGGKLDRASVADTLIPSYSHLADTLYDVDCILRIVRLFLGNLENDNDEQGTISDISLPPPRQRPIVRVGKLVDGYLAEIAPDDNLKPDKFSELALTLPDAAHPYHDGRYRAVDIYLKAHPGLTTEQRDRVSSIVDCRKLTPEACAHLAQNDRMPLRSILQVLFFEQLQLRRTIAGTPITSASAQQPQLRRRQAEETRRSAALRESQVLKLDMDSMQNRVQLLERECSGMKAAIRKIHVGAARPIGVDVAGEGSGRERSRSEPRWRYRWKFSTRVCDSQERAVVAGAPGKGTRP